MCVCRCFSAGGSWMHGEVNVPLSVCYRGAASGPPDHTLAPRAPQSIKVRPGNSLISYRGDSPEKVAASAEPGQGNLAAALLYVAIRLRRAGQRAPLSPMSVSFLFIIMLPAKCRMDEKFILVIHRFPNDRNKHRRSEPRASLFYTIRVSSSTRWSNYNTWTSLTIRP